MDESRTKKIKKRTTLMLGAIIALGIVLLSIFAVFYIRARAEKPAESETLETSAEEMEYWENWLDEVEELRAEAEGN